LLQLTYINSFLLPKTATSSLSAIAVDGHHEFLAVQQIPSNIGLVPADRRLTLHHLQLLQSTTGAHAARMTISRRKTKALL
jgi:hypothetical protein